MSSVCTNFVVAEVIEQYEKVHIVTINLKKMTEKIQILYEE